MARLDKLKVCIFADGADLAGIVEMSRDPLIQGFTTNPTLMRKAGVQDYREFAGRVLQAVPDRPVSFEVFSDEFSGMHEQALEIATWGRNVNVKIPVMNTRAEFAGSVIKALSGAGVTVNVTAVMTSDQVAAVMDCLAGEGEALVSVFAGRIADTGRDPMPIMAEAMKHLKRRPRTRLIWASPREVLNIFQAEAVGCDIITVSNDLLQKLKFVGKDLLAYSLETVRMFREDAVKAGYRINS